MNYVPYGLNMGRKLNATHVSRAVGTQYDLGLNALPGICCTPIKLGSST